MKSEIYFEISIRPVFMGRKSVEQVFIELIRSKYAMLAANRLATTRETDYADSGMAFQGSPASVYYVRPAVRGLING